jgi:hypothetical protein
MIFASGIGIARFSISLVILIVIMIGSKVLEFRGIYIPYSPYSIVIFAGLVIAVYLFQSRK